MLREATAAGRCKHSAPAAHYCRAKPPGGAYLQGTGSGTNASRRPSPAAVAVRPSLAACATAAAPRRRHCGTGATASKDAAPPPGDASVGGAPPSRHRGSEANASSLHRFSVEDKLKEIVAEQLGVEQSSITPEASFASDLGADSLDVVEMVMKIEEEFNVELPDERAEEVQNLSDAVRVVTELTA